MEIINLSFCVFILKNYLFSLYRLKILEDYENFELDYIVMLSSNKEYLQEFDPVFILFDIISDIVFSIIIL
jgi:hypothetical protein